MVWVTCTIEIHVLIACKPFHKIFGSFVLQGSGVHRRIPGALESPRGRECNEGTAAPPLLPVDLSFHFQVKQIKICIFSAAPASSGDPTSTALRSGGIQLGIMGGELCAAVPAVPRGQCRRSNLVYNFPGPRELLHVSSGAAQRGEASPGREHKVKLPALSSDSCRSAVINRWDTKGKLGGSYLHVNQRMFPLQATARCKWKG